MVNDIKEFEFGQEGWAWDVNRSMPTPCIYSHYDDRQKSYKHRVLVRGCEALAGFVNFSIEVPSEKGTEITSAPKFPNDALEAVQVIGRLTKEVVPEVGRRYAIKIKGDIDPELDIVTVRSMTVKAVCLTCGSDSRNYLKTDIEWIEDWTPKQETEED